MERKSNVNVNWTLQIIFLGFTLLVAMVMGYLTVGLTVHKMDEVLSKAELHLTHKRVRDILMVNGPDGEAVLEYLKDLRKKRQPQSSGRGGEDEQDTKDQDVIVCAYVNDRDRQKKKRSDYSSW